MHLKYVIPASLVAAMLCSCATMVSTRPVLGKTVITPETVLEASPLAKGIGTEDVTEVDILAISPDMVEFLNEHVDPGVSQFQKLKELVYTVVGEGRFDLDFDGSTHTAEETFQSRRGNCLSFTNMFIAMARELGLPARYQEVEVPPDWSLVGQTFLLSEHVNVLVDFNNDKNRIVDFNFYGLEAVYKGRVISDRRAFAHYYNNIGVEYMLTDETTKAFANFRKSINMDPTFNFAWINLGNLHRRGGYLDYAESAYLQALKIEGHNLMAMSNLANLYEQVGKSGLAEKYRAQVRIHRMANPYYRYQLANMAFNEGDYKAAIQNLKFAIHRRDDDDRFYYLLSLSYLMSGEKEEAQKWMKKAEEVARKSATKQRYQHKLDLLQGLSSGAKS